jgi:hypothetical protein
MDYSKSLQVFVRIAFVVGLVVGGVACGDDEDDGGTAGTAGMGGSGGSGGSTGGTGGSTGGTGGMGGTGGATTGGMGGSGGMMAMPMTCGSNTCNPITTATMAVLPACCVTGTNACGVYTDMAGTQCTETGQDGVLDESCPSEKNALNADTPGCCRPDGKCGLMSMTLLSSCVERTKYPGGFLMNLMPLTDMMDCTYVADEDAGM